MTPAPAVLLPCRNARHLLWRSLASVAAQTVPPAQILVLDRGSSDGLADWLRVRWPGIGLRTLAADADPAAVAAAIGQEISAPSVALLRPGEHWPRTHLEELMARPGGLPPTAALTTPAGVAQLPWPQEQAPAPSPRALAEAIATLPESANAILLDLRAAGAPGGLLDLLGLASLLGPAGRSLRAFTLAELSWPALEAWPAGPLLVSLSAELGLARASEQACLEEVLRRATDRPVRLIVSGLCAASPPLLSRLMDAILAHPDVELWLADGVSLRLAQALLGRERVRLVSPPLLALAPIMAELTGRAPLQPAMLGRPEQVGDLGRRLRDHAAWWEGFDPGATRRLGLALARVTGRSRWLKGPVLQQAWFSALVGWAVAHLRPGLVRTQDPELAMFVAICGGEVELVTEQAKARDLAATWKAVLAGHGVLIA